MELIGHTVADKVNAYDANIDYEALAGAYTSEAMAACRQALELVEDAAGMPPTIDYMYQRSACRSDAIALMFLASLNIVSLRAMGHRHAAKAIDAARAFVGARLDATRNSDSSCVTLY